SLSQLRRLVITPDVLRHLVAGAVGVGLARLAGCDRASRELARCDRSRAGAADAQCQQEPAALQICNAKRLVSRRDRVVTIVTLRRAHRLLRAKKLVTLGSCRLNYSMANASRSSAMKDSVNCATRR